MPISCIMSAMCPPQPPQGVAAGKVGRDGDGAKYIDAQNQYGWTALMQAACYGHSDCVQLLLQRGANLQLSNSWKVSCLVIASQGGHFGVVHTLINNGAKVGIGGPAIVAVSAFL